MNFHAEHQLARTDQTAGIKEVLSKLGDTIYKAEDVEIRFSQTWFIPRSMLADWRRALIEKLPTTEMPLRGEAPNPSSHNIAAQASCFNFNISNRLSRQFIADGGTRPTDALEVTGKLPEGQPLMTCRFCLRYQMGWCPQHHRVKSPYQEPYYLCSKDGRRFRLEFDCKKCEMKVLHA
jgi:putative protease